MDLAKTLVRTIVRGFYASEYVLIIDALAIHSTLSDQDLAQLLGMQSKPLRKLCAKLKDDGLIMVQSRGERKEGAPPAYHHSNGKEQPKERLSFRDWYFINFHRAIDSIKYRLWKLNRHIESQGASTTEKKDLVCPRCGSTYTELEVMDKIGADGFHCHRCDALLESVEEGDDPVENETMKRMNDQLSKVLSLMRTIDASRVPENDFEQALQHYLPVERPDSHPGSNITIVDDRSRSHIASSRGLAVAPEKVSVELTDAADAAANAAAEANAKAQRQAEQRVNNALPVWITHSTVNGEKTAEGTKQQAADLLRREHEGGSALTQEDIAEDEADRKRDVVDNAVMDEYWAELKAAQERERQEEEDDEDEDEEGSDDEEDEGDFEDVDGLPAAKRQRLETTNGGDAAKESAKESAAPTVAVKTESSGKVSDADDDDDDDELEFEDV